MIFSRRTLLTTLAAVPVGVGAALGIRQWLDSDATIRFIGQDDCIIALLDTGNERVVALLGSPAVHVLDNIENLLPIGRHRVDLIIGSHHWLTTDGLRDHFDLHTIDTISLQESLSVPPIRGKVHPVFANQSLALGDSTLMELSVTKRQNSSEARPGTNPDFRLDITIRDALITLASRPEAVERAPKNVHLMAVPGEVDSKLIRDLAPELMVGTELLRIEDTQAFQTHYNEPLGFSIANGSVRVREDQLFS